MINAVNFQKQPKMFKSVISSVDGAAGTRVVIKYPNSKTIEGFRSNLV